MESWWDYFSIGMQYLSILVDAWMIGVFFRPFLYDRKKAKWITLFYAISMSIIFPIPWDHWVLQPTVVGFLGICAGSIIIEKRNIWQKVFLSITSYLLVWITNGLSILPWSVLWSLWGKAANSPLVATNAKAGMILILLSILINVLNLIYIAALMYLLVRILHRAYVEKHRFLEKKELLLFLTPYLTIISGYYMIRYIMQIYEKDMSQYIWDRHSYYYVLLMVFQVMSYLTILAEITIYGKIKQTQNEDTQRKLLSGQVSDLKEHISEVENLYRGIRGMKHDLNNHIHILQDLYEKGEYGQAKDYLADMKSDYSEVELDVNTGNPITDIIIIQKQKEADAKGVSLSQQFVFPDHGNLSAYDVSIILNNILSNAIAAAAGSMERKVSVRSKMKNDIYFIEVTNSFDGTLILDEETGLPETTKHETEGHGLGLRNVKKAAEKYFGTVDIEQKENEVIVSVMIVIP